MYPHHPGAPPCRHSIFLSQRAYLKSVLARLGQSGCCTALLPMITKQQLCQTVKDYQLPPNLFWQYLQAVASLMYAMLGSRLNLAMQLASLSATLPAQTSTRRHCCLRLPVNEAHLTAVSSMSRTTCLLLAPRCTATPTGASSTHRRCNQQSQGCPLVFHSRSLC